MQDMAFNQHIAVSALILIASFVRKILLTALHVALDMV